jgi:hypothetical protein
MSVLDLAQESNPIARPIRGSAPAPLSPLPARMVAEPISASPAGEIPDLAQVVTLPAHPNGSAPPAPTSPLPASIGSDSTLPTPAGDFDTLRVFAESYEDVQQTRNAICNRIDAKAIPVDPVKDALDALEQSEKKLRLAMRRAFRRAAPEVRAWVLETPGVGEHLMARLLGVIGHPVIATPYHWEGEGKQRKLVADPPYLRSVSQLWSYCGHGDPTRRRRKGMAAEEAMALGNPRAKMLVHLMADRATWQTGTCGRRRSPYRDVYELARARYAGEDKWASDSHRRNSALRVTGKAILKDLWIAANDALDNDQMRR